MATAPPTAGTCRAWWWRRRSADVVSDAATWLGLSSGRLSWADAVAGHHVQASGSHADISTQLAALVAALDAVSDATTGR